MRLNKTLSFAVRFARFAGDMGIPPADLAQMIAAAEAAKSAYERGNNSGCPETLTRQEAIYDRRTAEIEAIATRHGCEVDWPGLWPCVQKIGQPRTNALLPSP